MLNASRIANPESRDVMDAIIAFKNRLGQIRKACCKQLASYKRVFCAIRHLGTNQNSEKDETSTGLFIATFGRRSARGVP